MSGMSMQQGQAMQQHLSPMMRYSLNLLQMPGAVLAEEVARCLEDNPFLEKVAQEEEKAPRVQEDARQEDGRLPVSVGWEMDAIPQGSAGEGLWEEWAGIRLAELPESLSAHLTMQLAVELCDEAEHGVVAVLIDALDSRGYLIRPLADLMGEYRVDESDTPLWQRALRRLQSFDPTGVGAENLAECLRLQLAECAHELTGEQYDALLRLLTQGVDMLARCNDQHVAQALHVTRQQVVWLRGFVRRMDPCPGRRFGAGQPGSDEPELGVRQEEGGWCVHLLRPQRSGLRMNPQALAWVQGQKNRRGDRAMKDKYQEARQLLDGLAMRDQTLLRVTTAIVHAQQLFFTQGVSGLQPLLGQDLAESLAVSASTVSRAIAGKHIRTPRGCFPLSYFLGGGRQQQSLGRSPQQVKHEIERLVTTEEAVLSDQKIATALQQSGVKISRRTVAKYRESLGIPAAVQRRKERPMDKP